ncbi:MAG: hypothetical protein IPP31_04005 [Chitinophagaceae bacterium]|nr:hypothetical protein [Chitinophagaceae bacterium]
MNYEIVELEDLSGSITTIYSIVQEGDDRTLLEHFIDENIPFYKAEVSNILARIQAMAHKLGAREQFFRLNEGKPGDGVCALYDDPDSALRLYCIRYGTIAIILGGGGPKPPGIRAWQDDEKLTLKAETMIQVSKDIMQRLKSGDLKWSPDGSRLTGNLTITDNDE